MIFFLVSKAHRYTIDDYLKDWGRGVRQHIEVVPYEALRRTRTLMDGAYVFADLDRLSPPMRLLAAELHDRLSERGDAVRLFNHPQRSLRRFELLHLLHQTGRNGFRAYRATAPALEHFPVFLRLENARTPNLTPLLGDQVAVEEWTRRVARQTVADGYPLRELLVVEFLDSRARDGIFRRYAAFVLGDRIVPWQVNLSRRRWMLKGPDLVTAETIREEERYVDENPHAEVLRGIAREANIQFGRFDYTALDGEVQVWELNTNPAFGRPRRALDKAQVHLLDRFADV